MNNLKGFQLAIELATTHRDACHKKLAALERSFASAGGQLEQLQSYAADKDAGWINSSGGGFSGELIRHHFQFMARLQQAMQMQSEVIAHAHAQVEHARKVLAASEVRLEALNRILKLRFNAKELLLKRRDQKQTDEFASQQYARRRAESERGEAR
jgi:flagellar FliJ protein